MFRAGLQIPDFSYPGVPDAQLFEKVSEIARTAESAGFDSLWVMDHFYQITVRPQEPMFEAYTILGALAARTERVKLGALVAGVTYRNPAMLAKATTTLDVLSSGRAILGIGAAWNEFEATAYGYDFPGAGERLDRLEDAVQIARLMFTEESPSFEGKHHRIREALNRPRPVTPGGPPIMIGGSGEKRTLKLVAKYADACNLFGGPDMLRHKLDVLAEHCTAVGRDPGTITRSNLKTVAIGATEADARRRADHIVTTWGLPPERVELLVVGTVDQVAEQLRAHVEAGLDATIVNLACVHEIEPVELAAQALKHALG